MVNRLHHRLIFWFSSFVLMHRVTRFHWVSPSYRMRHFWLYGWRSSFGSKSSVTLTVFLRSKTPWSSCFWFTDSSLWISNDANGCAPAPTTPSYHRALFPSAAWPRRTATCDSYRTAWALAAMAQAVRSTAHPMADGTPLECVCCTWFRAITTARRISVLHCLQRNSRWSAVWHLGAASRCAAPQSYVCPPYIWNLSWRRQTSRMRRLSRNVCPMCTAKWTTICEGLVLNRHNQNAKSPFLGRCCRHY